MQIEQGRSVSAGCGPDPLLQHATLRARAEQVEARIGALSEDTGPAAWNGEALEAWRHLCEFRRLLLEHLVAEEESGIVEQAVARAPRLQREADRLSGEHASMRRQVQLLVGEAERGRWTALYAGFVVLRRVLLTHERAETELIQRAYCEDLGGRG